MGRKNKDALDGPPKDFQIKDAPCEIQRIQIHETFVEMNMSVTPARCGETILKIFESDALNVQRLVHRGRRRTVESKTSTNIFKSYHKKDPY